MNFEKVELFGFKSFADKAEIKFGNGVTCIVGPNGCGKSNVADSIRWVMGEQSAKTLRGSSMQDVIFGGTQTRKPLSYCEVSLFFDNSNKIFKSMEYSEVVVTRKLFRSGESEYYINRQPARMRDIVDLLREVGIDKEGYTIIGQGQVEKIMSAKPEDRRAIFEAATGISRFKADKAESERRLLRAQENMTRISDIMAEKQNRLGPLEKQAAKAREYNELTASLRHHELNTYISKVDSVGEDKQKINVRIQALVEQSALRTKDLEKNEAEYNELMEEFNSLHKIIGDLNRQYTDLCITAEKRASANSLLDARMGFLQEQIVREKETIETAKRGIENDKNAIESGKKFIEEAKKELALIIAEDEELSLKVATLNEKIAVGESLERESNKKIISSIESLSDQRLLKNTADTELNNYSERAEELRSKMNEIDDKREKCFFNTEQAEKNIVDYANKINLTKENIEKTELTVREYNEEVAKIDNKIYELNSILATLKTKETFYLNSKDNYQGYIEAVQKLQQHAKNNPTLKNKIKGVVGKIISCDKKYDLAIETALGGSVHNVVTENADDGKYLIQYLKSNKIDRITFLPIDSVRVRPKRSDVEDACKELGALGEATSIVKFDKYYDRIISSLLGNTLIVDNLENATKIAKKYAFSFKIVTLEGDVLATQGSMTGGASRRESHGIMSADRKLEDIVAQIKQVESDMSSFGKEKTVIENKRDQELDNLDHLEEELNTLKQNKVLEEQKKSDLEVKMHDLDNELSANKEVLEIVEKKISELLLKLKTASGETEQLEKAKVDLSGEAEKNSLEADTLKKQKEEYLARQTELKVNINSIHSKIDSLKEDIKKCEDDIVDLKKSIALSENEIEQKNAIIAEMKAQQSLTAMTAEERKAIDAIQAEINSKEDRSGEIKKELEIKAEKRQQLQDEINSCTDKKHLQEIDLAKVDSDLEYLQQSVWEDYQETYETAQKDKEENYDVNFGLEEIQRIRKRRNFLGNINANAIDDYRAEMESFNEYEVQLKDLNDAKKDIEGVLDDIRNEMITTFDEGFKKINDNFSKIFKELFGGGRAMLELDYSTSEDKLEAGVEIKVEPPGKKLQKLSLLSGGEKALTAIAILFSILRLKPMAFCVLDEIEAALDEANVDRFARYLKKFSQETQFIVITHRKPTMELADNLFGVTMEEKGVSKLVSVKLSDVVFDEQ